MNGFDEVNESYSLAEAIRESQRCLRCKVPMCQKGCPIGNEIPEWIHELSMGNLGNAIKIIRTKSNLPAVCGRVCGHEKQCEGSCVLGKSGKHINIGKLERFVADFDAEAQLTHEAVAPKNRGKIAVVGSGPAGLTVAGDLARKGFSVEIFEVEPEAGGMLTFGIPEYRLPKEVVRREVRYVEELGVAIHLNSHVGLDITVDDLFRSGFDAVFIGIGAGKPRTLEVPVHVEGSEEISSSKEGMPGVRHATHFLRRVQMNREGHLNAEEIEVKEGDKVFVVGCGNTAMDAARTSLRLGAEKVEIVYHRTIDRMAALRAEYDDAVKEGILFNWNASIVEIFADKDKNIRQIVIETKNEDGSSSRRTVDADIVLMAVGAVPSTRIPKTTNGIKVDDKGYLLTREVPYGMTSLKGVFAGGDVANRQATVVHAMQDAKKVAEGITQYVDAVKLLESIALDD